MKRIALAVLLSACAQASLPPGGPIDEDAPLLLATTPDSGQVRAQLREVEFQFDEVVAEQGPGGALSRLVLVSPSSGGEPDVRWHRSRLTVRQRGGWRDSTTYVVTLLPGVADLSGNARKDPTVLVFSTGSSIPNTRVNGVVFDWVRDTFAPQALIQARPAADTSLVFTAEADSTGRFALPFLVPGTYVVRALIDANRNRGVDPREQWDSVRVELRDSAFVSFYTFAHDSVGPRATSVSLTDSLTLRIVLDFPLSQTAAANLASIVEVMRPDSSLVPIASVRPWRVVAAEVEARERARRDSIARADTSVAALRRRDQQMQDSANRAAQIADSIARDTTRRSPPPRPARPPLITEIGVVFPTPVTPGVVYRVRLRLTGMMGNERTSTGTFSRPRPRPDTTSTRGQ